MTVSIQGVDKVHVYVQGVNVKQALDPANDTVNKGLYNPTTLSTVDIDLATGNIKSGITIFGKVGSASVLDVSDADAAVGEVLAPRTFYSVTGPKKTGTMGDYSAAGITIVPSPSKQNLPAAGYWLTTDASVRVLGSAYLIGANIKSGVTIFGVTGTYDFSASPIAAARMRTNDEGWVNGAKITGSGTVTLIADNTAYPAGYHVGAANLAAIDADLAVGNIKTGVNIFGYVGTYDTTASAPTAAQMILNKVAWANGAQITGTMPTVAIASGSNTYPTGYHVGNGGGLSAIEATLAVGNIKTGVNIFGYVGTLDASAFAEQATVAMFQTNPAHGVMGTNPQAINDNNLGTESRSWIVNNYDIVNFTNLVLIQRYRFYGAPGTVGDGRWKIQYWNLTTHAWTDWVTDIPTRGQSWSDYIAVSIVVTTAIKLVTTTVDTGNAGQSWYIELEVIY